MSYNVSGASALPARAGKAALIVLAAVAIVLFVAVAVYAACCVLMMPPDDSPMTVVQESHGPPVVIYTYKAVVRTKDTLTVTRSESRGRGAKTPNSELWVTVHRNGAWYEISDPRGTGQPVIKLHAPGAGGPPMQ